MSKTSALCRWLCLVSAAVLTLLGVALAAAPAQAAGSTRYVANSGNDTDNDCTDPNNPCEHVQYAVDQADAGDTVSIAAGTYDESVRIRISLTLLGAGTAGANDTVIDGASDNNASVFVDGFDTNTPPVVTIKDLDVSGNSDDDGIFVEDATAHVIDCVVSHNDGNGIDIEDQSTGTVTGSDVNDNGNEGVVLDIERGDVANNAQRRGPVLPSGTVTDSTVNGNQDGGVIVEEGEATVTRTTLDSNVGAGMVLDGSGAEGSLTTSTVSNTVPFTSDVDAPDAFGGGVLVFPGGTVTIDTSTIFGNTGQGVLSFLGDVTINNSTISGTIQPRDEGGQSGGVEDLPYGGIAIDDEVPAVARPGKTVFGRASVNNVSARKAPPVSDVNVTGTIVADNTTLDDCNGDVTDGGYNLDSDGTCSWSATGSISNGNAKLGPLANNGGSTKTLLPAKGSAAIDHIPTGSANCSTSADDQRGVSRPQGKKCDIGAVEAAQPPIVFSPKKLPHGTVGKHYHAHITATGGLGAPYEFSLAPNSKPLPAGLTLHANGTINGTPTEPGRFPITVSVDDPTRHHYVIVITAPASSSAAPTSTVAPPTSGSIANTGAKVVPLSLTGVLAIAAGVLLLLAGWTRTRPGRHRNH
jgi:parallel beta-helix repeat protein